MIDTPSGLPLLLQLRALEAGRRWQIAGNYVGDSTGVRNAGRFRVTAESRPAGWSIAGAQITAQEPMLRA